MGVLVDCAKVSHGKEKANDKKDEGSQENKKDNKKSVSSSEEDNESDEVPADSRELASDKEGLMSTKPITKPSVLKKLFMQLFDQISTMVQGGAIYKDVDIDGEHKKMKFKEQYNGFHDNASDKSLAFYNIEININNKPVKLKENSTESTESKKTSRSHPKLPEPSQPATAENVTTKNP